jgi:hypothetical protein
MRPAPPSPRTEILFSIATLAIAAGLLYLPVITRLGYFNDDWYLMYAARAEGPAVFTEIFSVDRPLRALVMIPAFALFGPEPLPYHVAAFLFRLVGAIAFMQILRLLWPDQPRQALYVSLLFLVYPGFLSQTNAIDYLCHLAGMAAGMLSILISIAAVQASKVQRKLLWWSTSILLIWFYLGQMEWYIGLEFFRFVCLGVVSTRASGTLRDRALRLVRWVVPAVVAAAAFLIWRLRFFESGRGATDFDLQFNLSDALAAPLQYLSGLTSSLWDDFLDVLFRAWGEPLAGLRAAVSIADWTVGIAIAALVLATVWLGSRRLPPDAPRTRVAADHSKAEAPALGFGVIVFGLLPVILVGRSVDFESHSRYTLIASAGAAMLWGAGIGLIPAAWLRRLALATLLVSASLTHFANGLARVRETEAANEFWWQVSWRIPQLDVGTTLIAHYPISAEEDYFVWGPANLIYYPESTNESYVQPGIYAALLNEQTIAKVLARQPQEFSNRRGIRTYPNYRNILVLSKPTPESCVQVIDASQLELSSTEDARVESIASYSEGHHIDLGAPFRAPPAVPFGAEPARGWCYFYEQGSFFRQAGDWQQVARLGDEALSAGLRAGDAIEWLPFVQAYAALGRSSRLTELEDHLKGDSAARRQACQMLLAMPLDTATQRVAEQAYCT